MSDDLRALADDLARYVQQQAARGPDWMIVDPAPPAQPARDDAFQRECEVFVRDSLAVIARTRQTPAPQEPVDIFSAAAAAPEPAPAPLSPATKADALAALAQEVAPCVLCKLHGGRKQTVFGSGNPDADLVLIGEAPGRDEDEQGLPFVGRSGQLLTQIVEAIKLRRDEVYICNILKCRPPQNRDPEAEEVAACESYLKRQLAILEPRVILCLGRIAAQTLLGTRATLGDLRRAVHFYQGIPVMATYHPAALLRDPARKRDTWDDVRKLRALYDALRAC